MACPFTTMRVASSKSQLLYIGNEPLLSKATSALLRSAGYRVRSTSPSHIAEAVREGGFSVVILCATLSTCDSDLVVEVLERASVRVPIVSVQVGLLGDQPHPSSSLIVNALQGPEALVGAIHSVTRMRQQAS